MRIISKYMSKSFGIFLGQTYRHIEKNGILLEGQQIFTKLFGN